MTALDLLLTNARLATMEAGRDPYGLIEGGAVGVVGDGIAWVGATGEAPYAKEVWDLEGRLVTPGLIDCHTHLVFAGKRADEFEARQHGATYEEIARAGGGILATVAATRAASEDELLTLAARRAGWLVRHGATTIEVKSGYGLDVDHELRMLTVARRLEDLVPATIVTTLLGAHAVPPEFADDRASYVSLVCDEMIPRAARQGLADAVDVFCDTIGFTLAETERILGAAAEHGLPVKAHVGQLADLGGAAASAARSALSVDHCEHLSADDPRLLAAAGTVAVLLPGASYLLREETKPPVARLRQAGVPIAIATDLNPGTSPLASLPLACSLAAHLFGLTPAECLAGVTRHAAAALGRAAETGTIAPGRRADFAVWDMETPAEITYWMGADLCHATVHGGAAHVKPPRGEGDE